MSDKPEIRAGVVEKLPLLKPWLGNNYFPHDDSSDLTRWHVMGESHYGRPDDPKAYVAHETVTAEIVREWALKRSTGSAFFTRVSSIVENTPPDLVDHSTSWNSIAYSVFIQEFMDGPRIAPTREQWDDARSRFFGQLAMTRPSLLVVLGSRQWEQLPWTVGAKVPQFRFEVQPDWPTVDDAWLYPFWEGDDFWCTLAVKVTHPSAGFGRWNWQIAAQRAHSTWLCYSTILEYFYANYRGVGAKQFWQRS